MNKSTNNFGNSVLGQLITVIQRKTKKRQWAFANLCSLIRIHLFSYINLKSFLINPQKHYEITTNNQPLLFSG
ncbi:MAG TPA: hypothetical protein PKA54_01995 [Chitinophagaceae bacterium]|nr:hypothetical protein [Chitinophagaceae bacterium]